MSLILTCRKHPKYAAKVKPRVNCDACCDLWHIAEEARALEPRVFWSFVIEED